MDRDEIVRDLAETAAERLAGIVESAEKRAAQIEADARREAERIISAARAEANEQVVKAQGAVDRLVEQADELRAAVGRLGSDITSETPAPPEVDPRPPEIPEPTPPLEPEPSPPQTPEPTPPLEPEPSPPQTPEPTPPGPQISGSGPSTEDLLAQLKGDAPAPAKPAASGNGEAGAGTAERADAGDVAAARLVAMKMALDGAPRDEIAAHLADNFSLSAPDELLDDVLARAKA